MESDYRSYRRGSFFFPIALITVGVVWLLVNNGTIPMMNVYRLLPYWPVLIILAGLSLLFRRFWPITLLVWLGAAGLTLWLLTVGSAFLPQAPSLEVKHDTFTEPVNGAKSAEVVLDLSINASKVGALDDTQNLMVADIYYVGEARLRSTGDSERTVRLVHESEPFSFTPRIDQWAALAEQDWDIKLTPAIPLDLTVNASTGSLEMNLTALKLTRLDLDGSTGSVEMDLPASAEGYPVKIDGSTGSLQISVPDDTAVEFNIEASTGSVAIDIPDNAGVQVRVTDGGTGSLNLPSGFDKVQGDSDEKEGTYENDAFNGADNPITIVIDMSTGSINIR